MQVKTKPSKNSTLRITQPTAPWRLAEVKALPAYQLQVKFLDGTGGIVDLSKLVISKKAGVFAKLADPQFFKQVYLELGAVTWPGEIDLAPDAMYEAIKKEGKWLVK